MACSGARCTGADGTTVTVEELFGPPDRVTLGARGGFDTAVLTFSGMAGGALRATSEMTNFGFWGEHGFAALALGQTPFSGTQDGAPASGVSSQAGAIALGDASGTNPTGAGSATWTGIAEATTKDSFRRLQGTATVTVADLSRPRIGVAIEVPGHAIGAPGWAAIALANGRFATGRAGTDWIAGSLHGPQHQEAWGVFDTTGYVGAFGARREP